ncbi:MAG: hypothetical protein KGL35_00335 [Bradyrhizobium sp.]|nr:hypothetical protein [Pseudomonadota bacterium]MDE2467222.1 hypothetical protein [Bradyrhizobium sp.]
MEKFIHSQNLALYRKKLADPKTTDVERKMVERLLAAEEAKDRLPADKTNIGDEP